MRPPEVNLADVAYTLQIGRQQFPHKRAVICETVADGINALTDPKRVLTSCQATSKKAVAFLFTGLGTHYVGMARGLYQTEVVFKQVVDRCCQILEPLLCLDLRGVIYPLGKGNSSSPKSQKLDLRQMLGRSQSEDPAATKLNQTQLTQPAIFVIEYALAQLWQSWGIRPSATIGYSIGEYVAATIAGVFSLEDALTLVAKRAEAIANLPTGAMLAVPLAESKVLSLLNDELSLSAVNGTNQCVVSGTPAAVERLEEELIRQGLACRRLQTSHAFHSHMMEAIATSFKELVASFELHPPQIPYLSNLTGTWVTAEEVTQPDYWVNHLCQPVRFAQQVRELWQQQQPIMLEIGAGQTLSSLALQCLESVPTRDKIALPSLRHNFEGQSDTAFVLNTVAQLWLSGVEIDWFAFSQGDRQRIPLPTYPFERQSYWIDPPAVNQSNQESDRLWQSIVTIAQEKAIAGLSQLDLEAHESQRESLDRLCIAYIKQTLKQLGLFQGNRDKYSLAELTAQSLTIPRYQELLERWLDILVSRGELQRDEAGNFSHFKIETVSISDLVAEVKEKSSGVLAQEWIDIYHNYGINLPVILTGERQPLEFHFSMNLQQEGYTLPAYPSMDYYEPIMRSIIQQIVNSLPKGKKLRILELGAGTGSATEKILPLLPPKATEYTFTDVGSFFINLAQEKFKSYPFIEYGVLDVEKSPQEQGYKLYNYDLVIAFNVLHVARDIDATIDYGRSLLAPGGLLLLWEITRERLEADIMDGVLMQPIEDPTGSRNMGNPYLSAEGWQERLTNRGFTKVAAFSEFDSFGEHIIIAEADSSAVDSAAPAFSLSLTPVELTDRTANPDRKKPDLADWFYLPSWKRSPLASSLSSRDDCYLIFADELGLAAEIITRLNEQDCKLVIVRSGTTFSQLDEEQSTYTINPQSQADYQTLVSELQQQDLLPQKILHCWSLNNPTEASTQDALGFYSLLFLAQALGKESISEKIEINLISQNLQEVVGTETLIPRKALVMGAIKVIPTEYPQLPCRSIDIQLNGSNWLIVEQLIAEVNCPIVQSTVAYRGQHRWVQTFESVQLPPSVETPPRLRPQGVYLITGGLGRIGLVVAKYLAQTVKAKLVLTGRSEFPPEEQWSTWLDQHDSTEPISSKIEQLQEIQQLGGEILIAQADVSDRSSMKNLVTQVRQQWGDIQGVIHAAGIPVPGKIQDRTLEIIESVFAAKVKGVTVLEQIIQTANLDFMLLFSSLSSVSGGYAVDYVAASHFLDTYANYRSNQDDNKSLTVAIDWDTWQMAHQADIPAELQLFYEQNQKTNITSEEGIEILERILWQQFPQILVSPKELEFAIQQHRSAQKLESGTEINSTQKSYPRPNLRNAYVMPSNDTEKALAKVWQKFLGIEPIGIYDNFFALGGDSLTGSILINQLRDDFQLELPVRSLFESPTIAELAILIENLLIAELEALDEEEAQSLLQEA